MISLPGQKRPVQKPPGCGQWHWAQGWIPRIWRERTSSSKNLPPHSNPSILAPALKRLYKEEKISATCSAPMYCGWPPTKNHSWLKSIQARKFLWTLWSRTFMYAVVWQICIEQDGTFAWHCIHASHAPSAIWMPNPISLSLTPRFFISQGLPSFADLCAVSLIIEGFKADGRIRRKFDINILVDAPTTFSMISSGKIEKSKSSLARCVYLCLDWGATDLCLDCATKREQCRGGLWYLRSRETLGSDQFCLR